MLYMRLMLGSKVGRLARPKVFGNWPAKFISQPAVR